MRDARHTRVLACNRTGSSALGWRSDVLGAQARPASSTQSQLQRLGLETSRAGTLRSNGKAPAATTEQRHHEVGDDSHAGVIALYPPMSKEAPHTFADNKPVQLDKGTRERVERLWKAMSEDMAHADPPLGRLPKVEVYRLVIAWGCDRYERAYGIAVGRRAKSQR